jgi:hypothetical protein
MVEAYDRDNLAANELSDMTIGFAHKAVGHLAQAIGSSDTTLVLHSMEYEPVLSAQGAEVYLMLRGPVNRELVKVNIAASVWGSYLTVARGQGGTSAVAWPVGSMLFATTHADHYNAIIQRGTNRTIDYNPNEILTPLFAGEEVYQNSPAGCERWWKAFNGSDPYWDIITGQACGDEEYQDIGWDYDLLESTSPPCFSGWLDVTDVSKWTASLGSWDGSAWDTEFTDPYNDLQLLPAPAETWFANQCPTSFRITFTGETYIECYLYDQSNRLIFNDVGYQSLEEKTINYYNPPEDFNRLLLRGYPGALEITKIEFYSP